MGVPRMSDRVIGLFVVCRNCGEVLWNDEDETPPWSQFKELAGHMCAGMKDSSDLLGGRYLRRPQATSLRKPADVRALAVTRR